MTNDNAKVHGIFRFCLIAVVHLFYGSFNGGGVNLEGLVPMIYETNKDVLLCLYFRHYSWQSALRGYSSRLRC